MVTKQLHWSKILCGCFRFIWMWFLIAIMKRCAERCALQFYRIIIFFQLRSWIMLSVRTNFLLWSFHTKRVIFEIAMMKTFNKCIAGSLNNNYFRLMKVPASTYQCFVYTITTWKSIYLRNYSKTFHALILTP